MKRVIIVLTLCLLTCACVSNKPSKEILEREKYTNTKQIVKENIYGCWNFDSLDVYREKRLIYDANEHSTINFSKDSLEYCYYNEKSKLLCINLISLDRIINLFVYYLPIKRFIVFFFSSISTISFLTSRS